MSELINDIETIHESPLQKDLPEGWVIKPLGSIVDILDNKRVPINAKEREKRSGGTPYYGATGQVGWIDDYLFDEELVLLGEDGAPFFDPAKQKAYIIRGKSWVNNHAHVLRTRNGIPSAYIKFYLDIVDYHAFVTGTTRPKLNQAAMRQIPITVATQNDQKLIVAEIEKQFSHLDEAVTALKKIKANLKRYKASVLKSAVEGKLTEKWRKQHPNVEPASELLKRILTERRKKWEAANPKKKYKEPSAPDTSNLPKLPKEWVWVNIEQLAKAIPHAIKAGPFGSSLKKSFYVPQGYKIYGQEQVLRNDPYYGDYYIDEKRFTNLSSCKVNPGDILISLVGTIGRVLILPNDIEPGIINPRLVKLTLDSQLINAKFFKVYLESPYVKYLFTLISHGGTMDILNLSILKEIPIPLPTINEQIMILKEIDRISSIEQVLELEVETNLKRAERLRQSILKKAFSGKLVTQ